MPEAAKADESQLRDRVGVLAELILGLPGVQKGSPPGIGTSETEVAARGVGCDRSPLFVPVHGYVDGNSLVTAPHPPLGRLRLLDESPS